MTTATMSMTETLEARNETYAELMNCVADGTTDTPSFKALAKRLERLNDHLVNGLGYNGTN